MEDAVRPSQADHQRILARSSHLWNSYSQDANFQDGLPPSYLQLRNILGKVPAYADNGLIQQDVLSRLRMGHTGLKSKTSELFIHGRSRWRTGEGDCKIKDKVIPYQLLLGERIIGGNYLAILAFACAYILSARWLEMLQSNAPTEVSVLTGNPIRYLSSQAEWTRGSNEDPPDEDAARWWAAILATGEGWRAEFTHDGAVYRSPWSICIADVRRFRPPRKYSPQDMCEHTSASSEAALGYLSDFSMLHCLNSQCSVALAAALTFPFLGTWTVTLPLPIPLANSMFKIGHAFRVESCPSKITIQEEIELLPYYMTLSCNRRGMHSLVCGSFFDPQVSCNLVSSWFQPILDIIGPLVKAGDYEKIAIIMARRQPRLAALWMGAIISGMAEMILQWVRSGMSAIELHASAWTGTTQSFISLKPEVPRATDDSEIPRSDECRLLYLAEGEGYSRLPVCPWQPFGATLLRNTEIEVRLHATCTDHYLRYISWTWDLDDETALEDRGFTCDTEPLDTCGKVDDVLPLDAPKTTFPSDEMLSESATRCIFGWLRGSSGWPECEKEIHCHSWIASEVSDEGSQDSNSDNEFSLSIDTKQSIEGWLEQQELHDGKQ